MLTVAVTGMHAGENPQPGVGVVKSLRRRHKAIRIIGLVYDALESGIYTDDGCDYAYQIPFPSTGPAAFLDRLDYILTQHKIDIFIPTLDAEILPFIKLKSDFDARDIRCLLPSVEAFMERSKSMLDTMAESCGCKTPPVKAVNDTKSLISASAEFYYPMLIKGQYYDAYVAHSERELHEKFHKLAATWGMPVLVQQFVAGTEYNVIAVGDGEGDVLGYCAIRKAIVSEKGKGYGGIVIRDEKLDKEALRIIKHLKWRGPLELEFIKEEGTGTYYLLEINPRFPAWVDFPSTFDHNLPALVVNLLMNDRADKLPPYKTGKFFVRHAIDITCDMETMGQMTSTGELMCTGDDA